MSRSTPSDGNPELAVTTHVTLKRQSHQLFLLCLPYDYLLSTKSLLLGLLWYPDRAMLSIVYKMILLWQLCVNQACFHQITQSILNEMFLKCTPNRSFGHNLHHQNLFLLAFPFSLNSFPAPTPAPTLTISRMTSSTSFGYFSSHFSFDP